MFSDSDDNHIFLSFIVFANNFITTTTKEIIVQFDFNYILHIIQWKICHESVGNFIPQFFLLLSSGECRVMQQFNYVETYIMSGNLWGQLRRLRFCSFWLFVSEERREKKRNKWAIRKENENWFCIRWVPRLYKKKGNNKKLITSLKCIMYNNFDMIQGSSKANKSCASHTNKQKLTCLFNAKQKSGRVSKIFILDVITHVLQTFKRHACL